MGEGHAGKYTNLRVTGDKQSFSDEPLSLVSGTGGKVWQISASAKQIWDPPTTLEVGQDSDSSGTLDSGEVIGASNYSVNFLFGVVTFDTDRSGQTILANGAYYPHYQVPLGQSVDLSTQYNAVEAPIFFDDGIRHFLGVEQLEATFTHLDVENLPLDGQGGSEDTLKDVFGEARDFVLEVGPGGTANNQPDGARTGPYRRAWCKFDEESMSTALGEMASTELSMVPVHKHAAAAAHTAKLFNSFNF